MDTSGDQMLARLELDDEARGFWEPVLSHLDAALDGEDTGFLTVVENVARAAGLAQRISVTTLLDAYIRGSDQLQALLADADPAGARARRMAALSRLALTRVASGYAAGLGETIDQLRSAALDSSPLDVETGAIKAGELDERLALEVERCQRMDLSLGLLELALGGADDPCATAREALHEMGECLRGNLRSYDSLGLTPGGDFVLVFPDISRRGLAGAAERLRRELRACVGEAPLPEMVFALSHFDYVDVRAPEMLAGLDRGVREAKRAHQPLTWA